ncbi:hypothetical protein FB480_101877 [Agrobacterium vitis]|nr:hypothetical protein FB480_101877 [Agrobacterium vitis]
MRELEKVVLVIVPNLNLLAYICRENGLPENKMFDERTFRIITRVDALRGWRDGTVCLIDFNLFGDQDKPLRDLAHTLLAHGRIRRASVSELQDLRGEVV